MKTINLDSPTAKEAIEEMPAGEIFRANKTIGGTEKMFYGYVSADTHVFWMTNQDSGPYVGQDQAEHYVNQARQLTPSQSIRNEMLTWLVENFETFEELESADLRGEWMYDTYQGSARLIHQEHDTITENVFWAAKGGLFPAFKQGQLGVAV